MEGPKAKAKADRETMLEMATADKTKACVVLRCFKAFCLVS